MLILKKRVREWGEGGVGVGCHSLCLVDLSFDFDTSTSCGVHFDILLCILRHRVFPARHLSIRRHAQNVGVV